MKKQISAILSHELTGVTLAILVIFIILSFVSSGFLTQYNLCSLLITVAVTSVVGLAQMFTLSLGQFNLAVWAIGCLSSMLFGALVVDYGMPLFVAIIINLVFALLLGAFQGLLVAKSGINPFIITLALLSIYNGIASVFSKGKIYTNLPDPIIQAGVVNFGGIPLLFILAVVIGILVFIAIKYLPLGKQLLACGENPKAAVFSGISLVTLIIVGHALSGLLCGAAGILQIARQSSVQLSIGQDWMMTSFVAPVLGGTLLSGGKVSPVGTFFGALLVALINNGLSLLNVNSYWFQTFVGIILLIAFEIERNRKTLLSRAI